MWSRSEAGQTRPTMDDFDVVQSNGGVSNSSNPSVDNIEEVVWRLKIQNNDNQDTGARAHSNPYPDHPGEPDCIYYLRTGLCGYSNKCRSNHPPYAGQGGQYRGELPERVGQPDCGYFVKTGTCKYGSTYAHFTIASGSFPLPLSMKKVHVLITCKLDCVNLDLLASSIILSLHLLELCYLILDLLSMDLWAHQLYLHHLMWVDFQHGHSQEHHTYLVPAYKGSMSPVTSTSVLGSNFVYNTNNQGEARNLPMAHSSEVSPSKSSRLPDWIQKLEMANNKSQNLNPTPEDSLEQAGSPPQSLPASSEPPHDQSD
ncbi:hypothetical protein F0562_011184 [Nyssa sinensis]|uniref:C3H1-type domain-containing protein n=1 Tax=Nyssa sinensis TaxID=561372 RepID=A0A5J5A5P4_9ASTE|nr:hypothetical protein F0562_011184 [Nyssa sinensis]